MCNTAIIKRHIKTIGVSILAITFISAIYFSQDILNYSYDLNKKYQYKKLLADLPSIEEKHPELKGIWEKDINQLRILFKEIANNNIKIPVSVLVPYLNRAVLYEDDLITRYALIRFLNSFEYDGKNSHLIIGVDDDLKNKLISIINKYNGETRGDTLDAIAYKILAMYYPVNDSDVYRQLRDTFLKQ